MAWAEKLPSGKYRGVYRDAFGKARSVGTFTHKAKAERAAAAREDDARKAMTKDPDAYRRPWGEWCEAWWPTRAVAASTLLADKGRRDRNLMPRWEKVPLGSITRHDVKDWAASLRAGGLGPETVKRCVHLFSASLVAAVDNEILPSNPAARLRLPGGAPAQERYLTRDEYGKVRKQLSTDADTLIADLLVYTGMRWGEAAGLHWTRVDLDRGVVRIVETYDEAAGQMNAYPKGKRTRDVPLTPELIDRLGGLEAKGKDCGAPHVTGRCPGPLVLTTSTGAPLRNTNWTYREWRKAVEESGVGHTRVHDLRHTYASWLLQAGVPLAEVGKLLGHVSSQTTQRYAHLADTPRASILSALAAPDLPHTG